MIEEQMSLDALIGATAEIESSTFDGKLAIANNISTFIGLLKQQPPMRLLLEHCGDDAVVKGLTTRAKELLAKLFDPTYRNSADVPLAGYLLVLDCAAKTNSLPLIATYLTRTDLWWARHLASYLQPRFAFKRSVTSEQNPVLQRKRASAILFRANLSNAVYDEAARRGYRCHTEWVEKAIDFVDFAIDHYGQNTSTTRPQKLQFSGQGLIGAGSVRLH